jgi:hypothetical protein
MHIFISRLLSIGSDNAMYEYKFVRVDLEGTFTRKPKADHHRLIEEYAKEGWRLVQIFSPAVSARGGGIPDYFELIFERKIE